MQENRIEQTPFISVVIPVYQGEAFLKELGNRLIASLSRISTAYEVLFVNDASPDGSWRIIRDLCGENHHIKGINLSRNFGQHYAITAGLSKAKGDWIIVMDCDLQDIPEEIPHLYEKAKEGYDTIFAQRLERQDSWLKRMESKLFYKIFGYLTDTKLDASIANFGIYHRKVINSILEMGDSVRYFPTMARFVGYRQGILPVQHASRKSGKSSYSLLKLFTLAFNNIIAFSNKPLRLVTFAGFWMSFSAFIIFCFYLALYATGRITVQGWITLLLSMWMIGGLLMFGMGVIGVYIGAMFNQTKRRPLFFISECIDGGDDKND